MRIYEPEEDSYLLQEYVEKLARGRVLDMGTGSGIQAIAAAARKEVREVIAVDINDEAVYDLKEKKIAKIKTFNSDLFSNVKGRFDVIIFNPPYLPSDDADPDVALDGGKYGHELIASFLKDAKLYLEPKGFILLVFSNVTKKETVDDILSAGYDFEEVGKKSLPFFEELYVYKILPKEENIMRGKRGFVIRQGDVCIKEKNPESDVDTLANEAEFLKILNKKKIGPRFIKYENGKLSMEFIDGKQIGEFLESENEDDIRRVLIDVLEQCRAMDEMGINKFEMNNPYKHIIVTSALKPVLIDFERCRRTEKPKNVTQFLQYIASKKKELAEKDINIKDERIISLGREYDNDFTNFSRIKEYLSHARK